MADQIIKHINIRDLVLWTENPRDPIDPNATDQQVVNRAIEDKRNRWNLDRLAKEMGSYYDFSELPTVVYHDNKPVVYDGNRRIVLGKIKLGLVDVLGKYNLVILEFPDVIPCNVCDIDTALTNVFRKHADTGSWMPLERDIFLYKFLHKAKSPFLVFDEATGVVTNNQRINKRFVKEEILNEGNLNKLGFSIKDSLLHSVHSIREAKEVIDNVTRIIEEKTVSTRANRGKLLDVLDDSVKDILSKNKENKPSKLEFLGYDGTAISKKLMQSRRVSIKKKEIFGGNLYLRTGDVNNLYRDIKDLYTFYFERRTQLSPKFASLIRMSLRLLCETAAKEKKVRLDRFGKDNFEEAKKSLCKDKEVLTSMAVNNITKDSIKQLLHIGAHNYQVADNIEQTISLSYIIGAILTITHGIKP